MDVALVVETAPEITIGGSGGKCLGLPFHPFADIFPLMDGNDFARLVADIKTHGLREPIMTTRDGRIVDGRNRYRAFVAASIAPRTEILDIDDAGLLSWVLSRNLHRRHLTTAQRAAIAADLANLKHGGEQAANLPLAISQAKAAKMLKVSPRSLRSVSAIKDAAPQLHALIKAGKISTHLAAKIAGLTEDHRNTVVELVQNGDLTGAKAELKAKLKLSVDDRRPKSKTAATAAKTAPKKRAKPTANGFAAVYGPLLAELEALPERLASSPLSPDNTLALSMALREALALFESTGSTTVQIA